MPADLHLHSIYSDGSCTPTELVELARERGLDTVALADHDTVAGLDEMIMVGKERGIQVIPAIEFSLMREMLNYISWPIISTTGTLLFRRK